MRPGITPLLKNTASRAIGIAASVVGELEDRSVPTPTVQPASEKAACQQGYGVARSPPRMTEFRNTGQPDWDWWGELWPDPAGVLRELGLLAVDSLADVACGNGYFTVPAARHVGTVYGVDIDAALLAALDDHAASEGVEVGAVAGDARELPALLPERVAAVLLANTLHGVDEPVALARAVRESLLDGGRFAVVNWRPLPRAETTALGEPRGPPTALRLSAAETVEILEEAGFTVEKRVALDPYHYGVVAVSR